MEYAIIFSWKRAVAGRELRALEVLADTRMYFGKLAAEGYVHEPMLFVRPDNSMMIVPGLRANLFDIIGRDDFLMLVDKAMFVAEDFNYEIFMTADSVEHGLEIYAAAGRELSLM